MGRVWSVVGGKERREKKGRRVKVRKGTKLELG
jgi:hypothetical protein